MLPLALAERPGEPLRILVLGARTPTTSRSAAAACSLRLVESRPAEVHWVVLSSEGERGGEARASAERFLEGAARRTIGLRDFRNAFFRYGPEPKEFFEELKAEVSPDVVFTHYRHDLHQDHRLVAELTWNTFRDHLILEYEVPKYDGDLGAPSLFVPLEKEVSRRKVAGILEGLPSQGDRAWFTEDLFLSLMRLRGMECNSPSGYAEAFYCRKAVL